MDQILQHLASAGLPALILGVAVKALWADNQALRQASAAREVQHDLELKAARDEAATERKAALERDDKRLDRYETLVRQLAGMAKDEGSHHD